MQPNNLPIAEEAILRRLVDELIPGDGRWPSASEVGVHGVVSLRLSSGAIEQLPAALASSDGLLNAASERRISAVRQFEEANPVLFEKIYTAAMLAYYEMPSVVETIRSGGRPYSTFPHADGYAMSAFDLERDTPTHGRGRYLRTEDVVPLDLSSIDFGSATTERWGMER